jgi:hypothetical protein
MNRVVVRHAEELVNRNAMVMVTQAVEKSVLCLRPSVLLVVKKQPCRLSLPVTDRYIAEIASRPDVAKIKANMCRSKGVSDTNPFLCTIRNYKFLR